MSTTRKCRLTINDINKCLDESDGDNLDFSADEESDYLPSDDQDNYSSDGETTDNSDDDCENTSPNIMNLPADNADHWIDVSEESMNIFRFTENHGLRNIPESINSPLDLLQLFVDEEVLSLISSETNKNAKENVSNWKDVNHQELKQFLGLIIYMGVVKYPKISDYWSRKPYFKNNFVSKVMTRTRFQSILRFLHFSQNNPTDRLGKLRPFISLLNEKFKHYKVPGECLVIDETMIPFRERLIFRQYLPGKSAKYGVKLYKMCDPEGYTYSFEVYSGKEASVDQQTKVRHSNKVVHGLLGNYINKGRTLTVDNFYTNIELANNLLIKNTHLVGTTRKSMKTVPKSILQPKLKKGEIVGKQNQVGVVVGTWRDKRYVRFLTTRHSLKILNTGKKNRKGDELRKPEAIIFYNKNKQGVDVSDQMTSYFSPLRKTIKWYHKVGLHLLLGTAVVNALLIYKNITSHNTQIVDFREQIFSAWCMRNEEIHTVKKHNLIQTIERLANNRKKRGRCVHCYENLSKIIPHNEVMKKCKMVSTQCETCENKPWVCLKCFQERHK